MHQPGTTTKPIRFSLASLMLMTIVAAVLLGWWRDHQRMRRELDRIRNPGPRWGTAEVTGQPDTQRYGDIRTAWASKQPDNQPEWLILEYQRSVKPSAVWIYETYNPGAVNRVTVFDSKGNEHDAWLGEDPLIGAKGGIAKLKLNGNAAQIATRRIKIYLDSPNFAGWNEIDAVGLIDDRGSKQWAERAKSSSSYGDDSNYSQYILQLL